MHSLFSLMLLLASANSSANLVVEIDHLRNDTGLVRVAVFDQTGGFPATIDKALWRAVLKPTQGKVVAEFPQVPCGDYAVAVFHDENNNGKLDTNWIGIPKEGYGVSNNPGPRIGPPRFVDARFALASPEQQLNIRMLYF